MSSEFSDVNLPALIKRGVPPKRTQEAIYEQALHDFALTDLLANLGNCSRPEFDSQLMTETESELVAALLVEQLAGLKRKSRSNKGIIQAGQMCHVKA